MIQCGAAGEYCRQVSAAEELSFNRFHKKICHFYHFYLCIKSVIFDARLCSINSHNLLSLLSQAGERVALSVSP